MIRTHISSFFLAYIIVLTIVAIFVECLFLKVLLGIELKADGVIISLWAAILVIIAFVLYIIISLIRELYYATRVVKLMTIIYTSIICYIRHGTIHYRLKISTLILQPKNG